MDGLTICNYFFWSSSGNEAGSGKCALICSGWSTLWSYPSRSQRQVKNGELPSKPCRSAPTGKPLSVEPAADNSYRNNLRLKFKHNTMQLCNTFDNMDAKSSSRRRLKRQHNLNNYWLWTMRHRL